MKNFFALDREDTRKDTLGQTGTENNNVVFFIHG